MESLVCFISSNPEALELSLYSHYSNFTPKTTLLILDTLSSHDRNKAIASELKAIHVCEEEFKEKTKDEFKPLFQGKYGGNRNICLYYAFKEKSNVIFFDDDTTPFENPIEKYQNLFEKGKKIIVGKYLRHATGTQQMIKEIVETICSYPDKDLQKEKAKEKLLESFSGVPSETQTTPKRMGLVGGNMGISYDVLKKYCFFPTNYRVEDGTYGVLAKEFTGEESFDSDDNPIVFHNKTPKENALLRNLENELKGNVIALCIKDSLEENSYSMDSVEDKIKRNSSLVFKAFNLDYLQYKQHQKNILQKAKELGFEKEFHTLLSTTEKIFAPSTGEVESKKALFNYAQEKWVRATED